MDRIVLYRPALEELGFRQRLLADGETMAYNHAYGGTISFPRENWENWYTRWLAGGTGERFYRYLYHEASRAFVGEAAYYYDSGFDEYVCDVLVSANCRGQGFGRQGLALLCGGREGKWREAAGGQHRD